MSPALKLEIVKCLLGRSQATNTVATLIIAALILLGIATTVNRNHDSLKLPSENAVDQDTSSDTSHSSIITMLLLTCIGGGVVLLSTGVLCVYCCYTELRARALDTESNEENTDDQQSIEIPLAALDHGNGAAPDPVQENGNEFVSPARGP